MRYKKIDLLTISRPRFWLYLAGPFVIGYLSGTNSINEFLSLLFWSNLLYFLLPANIFLYGVNDLADRDTDQFNNKKKGYEIALKHDEERSLRAVLWCCVLLTIVMAYINNSFASTLVLGLFLFLSFAYSQQPFRWKAKPVIDSASNILYILPGILGYSIASGMMPSWWVIIGGGLWTAAMHLFSAIPDIKADSLAKLKTTAVVLGEQKALVLCSLLWLSSATVVFSFFKMWWLALLFIYSVMPLISFMKVLSTEQLYRVFPYLNAGIGFLLFWSIFLYIF